METDLMGGPFEPGQLPEGLPADLAIHKVLDIVKDCIVCHGALYNIVLMGMPQPAGHDKIQPLLRQLWKLLDL